MIAIVLPDNVSQYVATYIYISDFFLSRPLTHKVDGC